MQNSLDDKQRVVIPIAVFAANGNRAKLQSALNDGLNA